jgi:hypothetical protein
MHIPEGFSGFVTSTTAPVASGGSTSPGGPFTHWNNIAFSRRTPEADLAKSTVVASDAELRLSYFDIATLFFVAKDGNTRTHRSVSIQFRTH